MYIDVVGTENKKKNSIKISNLKRKNRDYN